MTYPPIILKILCNRQYVICHKNALLQEFCEKPSPQLGFENWCYHHGLEVIQIQGNLIKICRKSNDPMVYNAYLS
jgi:hypothetical protein